MDETSKDGRSTSQKQPEQVRAERIAAVPDSKLRHELDAMVQARDAQLLRDRARQEETFDKRVADLRTQKTNAANAPQLMPSGMQSQYRGKDGYARAERDADIQIRTHDREYLKNVAKEHNIEIDKRLDAHENVTPLRPQSRAAELIANQNYAARAQEAEAGRQKEQDTARQQQRQPGLQR
jgi:hypothetical protein